MTIKYIVFSGGCSGGLCIYGAFQHLLKTKYLMLENVNGIYATSVGCMVALFFLLKLDEQIIYDYLIKRPWDKIIDIQPGMSEILNTKGIFDYTIIKKIINPLITVQNLDENITLKQLYEYSNIDFHLYTTDLNNDKPRGVDLSHKTHPDLEVYKAIAMSSAIPIVFKPVFYNNGCYIDGGLLNNLPINRCIEDSKCKIDEVLVVNVASPINSINIDDSTKLHEYMYSVFHSMFNMIAYDSAADVPNFINCYTDLCELSNWIRPIIDEEYRICLVESGVNSAIQFLDKIEPSIN